MTFSLDHLLLLLVVAGASVDAVIFLAFGVFPAAQTGNAIILATAVAQGRLTTVLRSVASVVAYISGSVVGELVIVGYRGSDPPLAAVGRALAAELVPLFCLFVCWYLTGAAPTQATAVALISLAAIAMGIQGAAVLRISAAPSTTYITGSLTIFTTGTIRWLQLVETAPEQSPKEQDLRSNGAPLNSTRIYGLTLLTYLMGAGISAVLYLHFGELAIILPIAAIATVAIATKVDPSVGRNGSIT
jgi:uncharacterized membrane protein YoaK (UPF0700 family)